jgi:hypothetical protein
METQQSVLVFVSYTCRYQNIKHTYVFTYIPPYFLSYFNQTRIFMTDFHKKARIQNFTKIHLVGADLTYADGQTDRQT